MRRAVLVLVGLCIVPGLTAAACASSPPPEAEAPVVVVVAPPQSSATENEPPPEAPRPEQPPDEHVAEGLSFHVTLVQSDGGVDLTVQIGADGGASFRGSFGADGSAWSFEGRGSLGHPPPDASGQGP